METPPHDFRPPRFRVNFSFEWDERLHFLMIARESTWEGWADTDRLVDFSLVRKSAITEVPGLQHQITALIINDHPQSRNRANQEMRKRGALAHLAISKSLETEIEN